MQELTYRSPMPENICRPSGLVFIFKAFNPAMPVPLQGIQPSHACPFARPSTHKSDNRRLTDVLSNDSLLRRPGRHPSFSAVCCRPAHSEKNRQNHGSDEVDVVADRLWRLAHVLPPNHGAHISVTHVHNTCPQHMSTTHVHNTCP